MTLDRQTAVVVVVTIVAATLIIAGCTSTISPHNASNTSDARIPFQPTGGAGGANLSMSVINVGQGDSILLTFPHNESLLIDGGRPSAGSTVVAYLHSVGITRLDGVIATHPDWDHIGGLITVLESVHVSRVYDLGLAKDSSTYKTLLKTIKTNNINYTTSNAGDRIMIDPDTNVSVLNPSKPYFSGAPDNDDSIVIKVTYHSISYLLTGDAAARAEQRMIAAYNCSAYVLKVSHHGSSSASSLGFLTNVSPHIAVISVGSKHQYGHPANDTLARLDKVNATTYRTDTNGTVIVTTNGQTVDVKTVYDA